MQLKYKLFILPILLSIWTTTVWGQTPQATWVLNTDESSATKNYVARESIKLQTGSTSSFHFQATTGKSFSAKIDQTLVFPPTTNTYATSDGTITTDPTKGGVVGSIPGQFSVSPSGGASYNIPIDCPPGINGMQPSVSLTYNSQSATGITGYGWNISGTSMISRVSKSVYFDGDKSGIIWDNTSPLALDGQRLVEIQRWTTDSVEYKTETETYDRIIGYQIKNWGPLYFRVYTKSGQVFEYGNPAEIGSYFPLQSEVLTNFTTSQTLKNLGWGLVRTLDAYGNFIKYNYSYDSQQATINGSSCNVYKNLRINNIIYGQNINKTNLPIQKVSMCYETRLDKSQGYVTGCETKQENRLTDIRVFSNNVLNKKYHINYDTSKSYSSIASVSLYGTDSTTTVNPITFNYGNGMPRDTVITESCLSVDPPAYMNTTYNTMGLISSDFNGDGIMDLGQFATHDGLGLYDEVSYVDNLFFIHYGIKNSDGTTSLTSGSPTQLGGSVAIKGKWYPSSVPRVFGDFNGDGATDILNGAIESNIYYWKMYDFNNTVINSGNIALGNSSTPFVSTGNFDGDSFSDVIIINNNPQACNGGYQYSYDLYFCKKNGVLTKTTNNILKVPTKISSISVGDFYGRGKDDLFLILNTSNAIAQNNYAGGTTVFQSTMVGGTSSSPISFVAGIRDTTAFNFGDFNNDGLIDVVHRVNEQSVLKTYIAYNKGDGTFNDVYQSVITSSSSGNKSENDVYLVMDYNNDGLADIVVADEDYTKSVAKGGAISYAYKQTNWKYYLNSNTGYSLYKTETNTKKVFETPSCIGDFHKKGEAQWLRYDPANKVGKIYGFDSKMTPKLLTSTTNSLGNKLSINYADLTYDDTYDYEVNEPNKVYFDNSTTIDCKANNMQVIRSSLFPVVSSYHDGLNSKSMYYKDAIINLTGKGFLGFVISGEKDDSTDIRIESTNLLDLDHFILYPYKTTKYHYSSLIDINKAEFLYTITSLANNRYNLQLQSQVNTDLLSLNPGDNNMKFTGTQIFSFDSSGNPKYLQKDIGSEISETQRIFYTRKSGWYDNLVDSTIITTTNNLTKEQQVRRKKFHYNSFGSLTSEIDDPGDLNSVKTEYKDYDVFGHACATEVTANGITRKTSVKYTPTGRFISQKKGVLNDSVVYNWNEDLNRIESETGILGTTSYEYDRLGVLCKTTTPDNLKSVSVSRWAGSDGPTGARYYKYEEVSGSAPAYTWYDIFGREIRKDAIGLNGNKIFVNTEYNNVGLLKRVSEPYFEGQFNNVWAVSNLYDRYGRLFSTTTPQGTSTLTYEGFKTTTTTPEETKVEIENSAGQVVTSLINNKYVGYTYYPNGLLKSSSPGAKALTVEYDLQGHRTKLVDPDAGTITSKYNGFGELLWQKQNVHNSSEPITISYNYYPSGLLRSEVRKNEAATGTVIDSTVYSYDQNNHYRLTDIELKGKNKQTVTYGDFDRVTKLVEDVQGKSFTFSTEYDGLGRVKNYYYPTGYCTVNHFDKYGNMTEVTDNKNHSIWKAVEDNANGQLKRISKGGIETVFGYDSKHALSSIYAKNIQNMTFSVSNNGNLAYRIDSIVGQKENFVYDGLNRLTNWNISRGSQTWNNSLTYDTNGNIHTKSDLDNMVMNYGENGRPHALTSITGIPVAIPMDSLNVAYTDFKKIKTLNEGNKYYKLDYGVDDQRRKSDYYVAGKLKQTRYYLGDYEEEVDSVTGNVRKIHYLSGAILIQNNGKDSLLYTYTDNQGSLIALANDSGALVERYAYDPWGQRRDPLHWEVKDSRTKWITNRGYTGHEHLDAFGIINMNGRVFDPLTAQFFSPDPQLQEPSNWLNYNRYGYCVGNPMKYTDPSGEFFWMPLIAAMVMEGSMQGAQSQYFGDGYFGGFYGGALQGGAMYMASSILPGAIGDALGHGASHNLGIELARAGLQGLANGAINEGSGGKFWTGFATGAVSSLVGSGIQEGADLLKTTASADLVRFSCGAAGAITAGAMHGDAMSGFWQGYGIADQNHVGGEKGKFNNSESNPHDLSDLGAEVVGKRTFHGVPFKFISEKASYNAYVFSSIRTQRSSYEAYLKKGLDSDEGRVFMHEFGHYLQEKIYGKYFYYSKVVPTGGINYAIMPDDVYKTTWTEVQANTLSYAYFGRPKFWDFKSKPIDSNYLKLIKFK